MILMSGFLIGSLILFVLGKLIGLSFKVIMWLIVNGITGLILLYIFNWLGGFLSLALELNTINAIVAGVFGMPGVILLLIIKYLL